MKASASGLKADDFKLEGNDQFKIGHYAQAITCYSQALKLNASDETCYCNRSAALLKLARYEDALQDANKCIELKPSWAKGHYRAGTALVGLRKTQDAIRCLETALSLDPANEEVARRLQLLREPRPRVDSTHCTKCRTVMKQKMACSRCLKTFYCGAECQRSHWPTHKPDCHKAGE
eukprot:TRINITY_DN23760_c0_g1_i1.p1 TRINITY_DN23760_c0_g1~~TRINITY_DN23760_c0_g1_i1.p1  ORF type:complete len:177 (-),score=4.41 TRINITY_DN23760_c0_g1_i1:167-697(-)